SLPDIFPGLELLRGLIAKSVLPTNLTQQFQSARSELEAAMKEVSQMLQQLDPTLVDAAKHAESKMLYQMDTLASRAAAAELRKHADIARFAEVLSNSLYPNKELQERQIAGIHFLARYGTSLLEKLYDAAKVNSPQHQIFYL